jgi:agmatinase
VITVLGVPFDEKSSYLRGAAKAPPRIRAALECGAMNWCTEDGRDLRAAPGWQDAGDLDLLTGDAAIAAIAAAAGERLRAGERLLALGGDHAVTFPLIQATAPLHPGLTILHLDAHPDLYDSYEGDRFSHACPFARIMESGLAKRLVQVGIRTMTPHQRQQARRFGVETVEMHAWHPGLDLVLEGPLYLSLDMDAIDPAFAPGVAHHEPGGFSSREVLAMLQGTSVPLVGADLVEYNPDRDPGGITAALAAKLTKELLSKMLAGEH